MVQKKRGTKRVMGIDASFTTIGLAILDYNDDTLELRHKEFFNPPSKGNLFERLYAVRLYIIDKIKEFRPDAVVLEDIIKFMRRKSNAHTVTLLTALNRTVGLAVYEKHKKPPYLFSAVDIRNTIKIGEDTPEKTEIPELVAHILDTDFVFLKGPRGGVLAENYDMADAIACALCYVYLDMQGVDIPYEPIVKKKKRRKKRRVRRKKIKKKS